MTTTKITSLQIENVKRVKALHLEPTAAGLTVIGGKNGQGKTSVLDSIAWCCGGNRLAPSNPQRDGSLNPPAIDITMSNGIRVKRSGKNGTLTVLDPSGNKAGQALLDAFVGQFALDLPKFLEGNSKAKADALLQTLGISDQLKKLEEDAKRIYDSREAIGRIATSKKKHAEELPEYPDAPEKPVSAAEYVKQHEAILAKNGENQRKRDNLAALLVQESRVSEQIAELQKALDVKKAEYEQIASDIIIAQKSTAELVDESTEEIKANLENIESINAQVAANQAKSHAHDEATEYQQQYDDLSTALGSKRAERLALLEGANLPLPGLTVEEGELLYNNQKWDCMSGSEQLKVAVAIVRAMNPECGFVLMDKLEQMDADTMREFGAWLEQEGLQVIATRVSTSPDECTIIIEDGLPLGETYIDQVMGKDEPPEPPETAATEEKKELF